MLTIIIIATILALVILIPLRNKVLFKGSGQDKMYHLLSALVLALSLILFFAIILAIVCTAEIIFEDKIIQYEKEYEALNAELEQELTTILNSYLQDEGLNMYVDSKETTKVIKLYHKLMKDPIVNLKVQLYESNAMQLAALKTINFKRNKWLLCFAS